mgnify:CR=1 FL=1
MIGKVVRPNDSGQIKREEDTEYLDLMMRYTNRLSGTKHGEARHRVLRPYVMTYPETETYLQSTEHPHVKTEEDIVIRFRDRWAKQKFDRYRRTGEWPSGIEPEPTEEKGRDGDKTDGRRPRRHRGVQSEEGADEGDRTKEGESRSRERDRKKTTGKKRYRQGDLFGEREKPQE